MKKIMTVILLVCMTLSLTACGNNQTENNQKDTQKEDNITKIPTKETDNKYFTYDEYNKSYITGFTEEGLLLEEVLIPSTCTTVEGLSSKNLKSIGFANPDTKIYSNTFRACDNLTTVELPSNLSKLESSTFKDCPKLKTIALPKSLETIQSSAFENCTSLQNIEIPENVTKVSISVFENCVSLKNVVLPSQLKEIGKKAFYNCTSLEYLVIPEGVSTIDERAFKNCFSLKEIYLPKSLTSIEADALWKNGVLTVYVKEGSYMDVTGFDTLASKDWGIYKKAYYTEIKEPQTDNYTVCSFNTDLQIRKDSVLNKLGCCVKDNHREDITFTINGVEITKNISGKTIMDACGGPVGYKSKPAKYFMGVAPGMLTEFTIYSESGEEESYENVLAAEIWDYQITNFALGDNKDDTEGFGVSYLDFTDLIITNYFGLPDKIIAYHPDKYFDTEETFGALYFDFVYDMDGYKLVVRVNEALNSNYEVASSSVQYIHIMSDKYYDTHFALDSEEIWNITDGFTYKTEK